MPDSGKEREEMVGSAEAESITQYRKRTLDNLVRDGSNPLPHKKELGRRKYSATEVAFWRCTKVLEDRKGSRSDNNLHAAVHALVCGFAMKYSKLRRAEILIIGRELELEIEQLVKDKISVMSRRSDD